MKSNVPAPVIAAIIAIVVLVGGFLLWKKAGSSPSDAGSSGNIQAIANEVKSKSAPDFTPEQASGGAVMGPKKGSPK